MIELKRNKETGIVESWKDGKKIGEVITMGDMVKKDEKAEKENNFKKLKNFSKKHLPF